MPDGDLGGRAVAGQWEAVRSHLPGHPSLLTAASGSRPAVPDTPSSLGRLDRRFASIFSRWSAVFSRTAFVAGSIAPAVPSGRNYMTPIAWTAAQVARVLEAEDVIYLADDDQQ